MRRIARRECVWPGLLAVTVALAPAWQDPPPPPTPEPPAAPNQTAQVANNLETLAKARVDASARMFDLSWLYYSENRIEAGDVYGYSRLRLIAEQDSAPDKAGRIEAAKGHLERMTKLWNKIARVRKIGFGNTLDVKEAEYYVREAEFWVAREQSWNEQR
jgi:hypothetical protein